MTKIKNYENNAEIQTTVIKLQNEYDNLALSENLIQQLTSDNIEEQFRINRSWRALFNNHYQAINPDTYITDAWKLFVANGYSYQITRYSDNPSSALYVAIKDISLHDRKGEEIVARGDVHFDSALEQLMIMVICEFEVDFTKFK